MKIIVVSTSKKDEKEPFIVTQLFENGLENFHLRKPKLSTKDFIEYIEKIPSQFHNRIVIHSHHNLAKKYNLKGIHYTKVHQKDNFKNWWRNKVLGYSRMAHVKTASHTKLSSLYDETSIQFNYVFLSPIFDSLTGKYQSGFYEEGIRAAIQKSGKKIVARGGVDITRIEKVQELGFYGMALYSCIWESDTPVVEFIEFMKRCRELNIATD